MRNSVHSRLAGLKSGVIKQVSNLSIFKKIFFGITVIIFLVGAIYSVASYAYSSNVYEKEVMDGTIRLLNNISGNLEDNLDQIERIIVSMYSDPDILRIISTKEYKSNPEEYRNLQTMKKVFDQLVTLRKDLFSFYIYVSPERSYSYYLRGVARSGYDPSKEGWYKNTLSANGKTIISSPHKPYQLERGEDVISFSKVLKDGNMRPLGVILIDISIGSLETIIKRSGLSSRTEVFFTDNDGNMLYSYKAGSKNGFLDQEISHRISGSTEDKFTVNISKTRYMGAFSSSNLTGWKLLTFTPYSEVAKDGMKLLLFNVILAIGAFLFAMFISYVFSRYIFRPIRKLHKGMGMVKKGDFNFQLEAVSNDELGELVTNFNTMVTTIKTLILEKYEATIAKKDAEFKYLQSQINPHFIFNVLQVINSMAIVDDVPHIGKMAKNLARILRYSINVKQNIIPFKDELQNLIYYLDIQKQRFKKMLSYEINIDDDVLKYSILKLVLQPIVENSITHGIVKKGYGGTIRISAWISDECLNLEIYDNGVGMSESEVKALLARICTNSEAQESSDEEHNNIGLSNINRRIKIFYGMQYGMDVRSIKGEWTIVKITIPAVEIT